MLEVLTLTVKRENQKNLVFEEGQSLTIDSLIRNAKTGEAVPFVIKTTIKEISTYSGLYDGETYRGVELNLIIKELIDTPFDKEIKRGEYTRYYLGEVIRVKLEYFIDTTSSNKILNRYHNRDKRFVEEFIT